MNSEIFFKPIENDVLKYDHGLTHLDDGITAFIRLKDEAQTIEASLRSIEGLFDYYVILIQPSNDKTAEIVKEVMKDSKATIVHYPYESWPNGPGYSEQDETSVYSRTFFYNFGTQFIPTKHAFKWDGDMIASTDLRKYLSKWRKNKRGYVAMKGVECADGLCATVNSRIYTGNEVRIFKSKKSAFSNGPKCEILNIYKKGLLYAIFRRLFIYKMQQPMYYHFKYAKLESSQTKAWPENWREVEHFVNLMSFDVESNKTTLRPLSENILK
ncbi:hypothetical protein [Vibrio sp. CB1-14]|uniref:Uncharacterized protein n=1 Tax=Vibrio chaetopteri TaxID=3016528 RepID=A0AAU8BL25_9VIBR